jgi:hypothetical protein
LILIILNHKLIRPDLISGSLVTGRAAGGPEVNRDNLVDKVRFDNGVVVDIG